MKRAILYTLAAVLLAPAAAGVLDLFWWFWTGSTATAVEWSMLKVSAVFALATVAVIAIGAASFLAIGGDQ